MTHPPIDGQPARGRHTRVLLVEDNPGDAELVRIHLLDRAAYAVTLEHVTTLADAQRRLRDRDVDAVLLDLNLPDSFGIDAISKLREQDDELPIVVLTSHVEDVDFLAAEAGATGYVSKHTLDARALMRAIHYAINAGRAQRQLRRILNAVADATLVTDSSGTVTYANRMAELLFERDGADLLGQPLSIEVVDGAVLLHEVVRPSGERRWVEVRAVSIAADGTQTRVVTLRDTTDRRKAARELEIARRRLDAALLASGVCVFEFQLPLDPNARLDPSLAALLGACCEAIPVGSGLLNWLSDRLHPDDVAAMRASFVEIAEGREQHVSMEFRLRHASGGWRRFSVTGQVVAFEREDGGHVLVGVVQDVTDQRLLEQRLSQTHKMEALGLLAGGIAHDFNNLLAVIIGFGGFVREELAATSPALADMDALLGAAERAAAMTSQLLAFSRQRIADPTIVDANESLTALLPMLRRLLGERVSIALKRWPRPLPVLLDAGRLDQVIINLAVNARDAMSGCGALGIETNYIEAKLGQAAAVEIVVSDTGCGMDEATIGRAFEPFFTTKRAGEGTGMGLATCYGIVTAAGGEINVESSPGNGSRFRVVLPLQSDLRDVAVEEPSVAASVTDASVLVVEDDKNLRELMVRVLTQAGYAVTSAVDGEAALQWLGQAPQLPTLVISDIVMPRLDGHGLAAALRAQWPELPLLFVSGYSGAAPPGTSDHIEHTVLWKPFSSQDLRRAVAATLHEREGGSRKCRPVAGSPQDRSQRAELPHEAPAAKGDMALL